MLQILKNLISKKRIAGFFVVLLFVGVFAPVVFESSQGNLLAAQPAIAHAVGEGVGIFIGNIILGIGAFIGGIGGVLLENSIEITVLDAGEIFQSGSSLGKVIEEVWKVVRDISNLIFIFGFIYVGIATIIDPEKASTKRFLSSIIIGALLINFSLFFTKIIIDISNYVSVEMYKTLLTGGGSISAKLVDAIGMVGMFNITGANLTNLTIGGSLAYYFMGAIFLIVAGFVLASGAVLLITRFVALVFIMVFSPLLFAATVFPQTADIASKMWKQLFNYAFFAPAYLLLLIVSIKVLDGFLASVIVRSPESMANALSHPGTVDSMTIITYFVVSMMFLIFSLKIAQKFGVAGADKAVGLGTAAMFGAAGLAGRNATRLTGARQILDKQDEWRKSDSRLKNFGAATIRGLGVNKAANAVHNAKFGSSESRADVIKTDKEIDRERARSAEVTKINTNITNGTANGATPAQKIEMERSIANASTEQMQKLLKIHKSGPTHDALIQNMSSSQFESLMKLDADKLDDRAKADLRNARTTSIKNKYGINGSGSTPINMDKASSDDLAAIGVEALLEISNYLTPKQIDDWKGLTTTEKSELKSAREKKLIEEFDNGSGSAALFGRIKKEADRALLPKDILIHSHAGRYVTRPVLNKIIDNISNGNIDMSDTERDALKQHVLNAWAPGSQEFAALDDYFRNSPNGKLF